MDSYIVLSLIALNVWQHWFWSRYSGRLIDKLMSRNYAEYKQVEQSVTSHNIPNSQKYEFDSSNEEVLKELNGMLGGI